jgi:hypothetical protein
MVVKSAVASSGDKDGWKVVATDTGHWCQAKLSPAETYTITLAAPTPIATVVLSVDTSVASAEITADGVPFKGTLVENKLGNTPTGNGTITVKLGGNPASKLVVAVTGGGHGCVNRIDLGGPTVYATDASTLWSDVAAIKAAVVACDKTQIAAAFTFPFRVSWNTMDASGMKEAGTTYTTAAKLKGGCKNVHVQNAILKLAAPPTVSSTSDTALYVGETSSAVEWHLVLVNGHWRAKGFNLGS